MASCPHNIDSIDIGTMNSPLVVRPHIMVGEAHRVGSEPGLNIFCHNARNQ
jgi:hypothetical protein